MGTVIRPSLSLGAKVRRGVLDGEGIPQKLKHVTDAIKAVHFNTG